VKTAATVSYEGRTWLVELPPVSSEYECPRAEVAPEDDPEDRQTYAYQLGNTWHLTGARRELAPVFARAMAIIEGRTPHNAAS
jgi:hypothetical protein